MLLDPNRDSRLATGNRRFDVVNGDRGGQTKGGGGPSFPRRRKSIIVITEKISH